ncbi:MAG TPA: D-glycero-beta-D-manno-heptose-7-phosphate kinase [Bacteroidota bacterium]
MVTFSRPRLQTLYDKFVGKRIAVVGDLMLDRYFWGSVTRISPEAPVPVVEVESESTRLGGAANVANNIASLGGIPVMVGVIGEDVAGISLRKIIEDLRFPTSGIVTDGTRPTTVKTRVIAHNQHVVRIDHEAKADIAEDVQRKLLKTLEAQLDEIQGIILEDYNKGVLAKGLIGKIIELAKRKNKIVAVDPKFNNFFEYKGVTIFKPNKKETEEALGVRLSGEDSVRKAGKDLLSRLEAENVLLTMGEKGMTLFERNGGVETIPTAARRVADVSGAGDTVVSTLTMALASGADIRESSVLANIAGGIVCGEVGIVPIDKKVLFEAVTSRVDGVPEADRG